MLQQRQIALLHLAEKALHGEMKCGIVVFYGSQRLLHPDFRGQFFPDLPFDGLLRRFSRLNLAPRKFPTVFEFTLSPLGGENFILVDDQRCHDLYRFQSHLPFYSNLHCIYYTIDIVRKSGQQEKEPWQDLPQSCHGSFKSQIKFYILCILFCVNYNILWYR